MRKVSHWPRMGTTRNRCCDLLGRKQAKGRRALRVRMGFPAPLSRCWVTGQKRNFDFLLWLAASSRLPCLWLSLPNGLASYSVFGCANRTPLI